MKRPLPLSRESEGSLNRTPDAVLSTTLRSTSVGGMQFREHEVVARSANPRHSHDYHCIGFLIDGLGAAELKNQSWSVRPGWLNVIPGSVPHVERFGTRRIRWCGIEVSEPRDEFAVEARQAFDRPMQLRGGPAQSIAARIYRELRLADGASELSLHGLGLELLAVLARGNRTAERAGRAAWVGRAEGYIRASFLEALTLGEVAAEAGVHPTHLAREFRRNFGVSIGEYVRGLRIEHATALLDEGDMSLAEIAGSTGFADQAHFTRVFKRQLGVTPGKYRRRLRGC